VISKVTLQFSVVLNSTPRKDRRCMQVSITCLSKGSRIGWTEVRDGLSLTGDWSFYM